MCSMIVTTVCVCGLPVEDSGMFPGRNGGGSPSGPNFTFSGSNAIDELFTEQFCLQNKTGNKILSDDISR